MESINRKLGLLAVCFFGHREIDDFQFVEEQLEKLIRRCINENNYVIFRVGRDGEFDRIVSSTINRVKREMDADNVAHICVLPYERAEYSNNKEAFEKYYNIVEIFDTINRIHPKHAICIRNRDMVFGSDLCIFYVAKNYGGAYDALKYAKELSKDIINIADL